MFISCALLLSFLVSGSLANVTFSPSCAQVTCPDGPNSTSVWHYPVIWFKDPVTKEVTTTQTCRVGDVCTMRFRKWSDHLVAFAYWDFTYKYDLTGGSGISGNDFHVTCISVTTLHVNHLLISTSVLANVRSLERIRKRRNHYGLLSASSLLASENRRDRRRINEV